jgi:hypothetical protein
MKEEILCVSYFDYLIGPSTFYCNEPLDDSPDYPNLNRILDFNEDEGSFIFAFRKYQTLNHLFLIESDIARGGSELVMITYMIKAAYFKNEIVDVFNYLESKMPILEKYASDLKEIKEFKSILHSKSKPEYQSGTLNVGSAEFRKEFLNLYNKYNEKLSLKSSKYAKIGVKQKLKKIFIVGTPSSGKTTFIKNIESIQFRDQTNPGLPTRIFELVIDNMEILTYDCIEKKFECAKCENLGGCLENAQGFVFVFDLTKEKSIIDAKESLQSILNSCSEIDNEKIPVLLIGNKIRDKEGFNADYISNTFDFEELEDCGMKLKYYSMNIAREKKKIMKALRWTVRHMI